MDARRQREDAALVLASLVEHVRHGVDRPGIPRVDRDGPLSQDERLIQAPVLLQREGVVAQHVAVGAQGLQRGRRQLQHLGRAALPEVDVVETLHQEHVARVPDQDLLDQRDGVVAPAGHPERERLDVALLARRQRARARRSPVHLGAPLRYPLGEVQRDGERRARQHEVGIGLDCPPEVVDDGAAEAEEGANSAVIQIDCRLEDEETRLP